MGNFFTVDENVFHWEYTEEPHKTRREEILIKHPEIKKLMKVDGDMQKVWTAVVVLAVHIGLGFFCHFLPIMPCRFLVTCFLGTWTATMIMLLIHEAAHGTVFGPNHVWKNRIFGIVLNLGLGLPFYSFFKKHHKVHHKYLGDAILDLELPSEFEANYFPNNPIGKYVWLLAQPVIYGVRTPLLVVRRFRWGWDAEEILNIGAVFVFNMIFLFYVEMPHVINHLLCASMLSSQTNMFGFWGNMSHVEFFKHRETSCYYGWLNKIYFNFGYHMQHHDFPSVPSKYLPEVSQIAPEYYKDQFELNGFVVAAIKFIFDDSVGIHSRLKRVNQTPWLYSNDGSSMYRLFSSASA